MRYLNSLKQAYEARTFQERLLLLVAVMAVVFYFWLIMGFDRLSADREEMDRQIEVTNVQIMDTEQRISVLQREANNDPDAYARNRYSELLLEHGDLDVFLSELYGQLISPREMASVLTTVLQRETSLVLVGLENTAPESLIQASADSGLLEVYSHGLSLELEGDYLEVIRYLQSLEALDSNFFWESLSFELAEHPDGRITLSIFTLSTDEGWIGV